jgi:hypothetical protein
MAFVMNWLPSHCKPTDLARFVSASGDTTKRYQ